MNLRDLKTSENALKRESSLDSFDVRSRKSSIDKSKDSTKISFKLDDKSNLYQKKLSPKTKSKMGKWSKFFLTLFLLVLAVGGSVFGYFYYQNYKTLKETGVENVNIFTPLNNAVSVVGNNEKQPLEKLDQTEGKTNFLLIGVDARSGFTSYRTDTMIIASYNHDTKKLVEVSIPRDIRAKYENSYVKLNAIFQYSYNEFKADKMSDEEALKASFDRLTEQLYDISGMKIHYGVMINFNALKEIVDALGNITVDVDKPLYDNKYPNDSDTGVITINFKTGVQEMNGTKALQYARSRETTSDYDRARRQQQVINAIKDKFMKSNLFTDLSAINGLISAISKNIKFFKVDGNVISELFAAKSLLNDLSISNLVVDPTIGSYVGQILTSQTFLPAPGFIIYPSGGKNYYDGDYEELKAIIKTYVNNPALLDEDATVQIVYTDKTRFKEFDKFNDLVLEEKLPFTYNQYQIKVTSTSTNLTPTTTNTEKTTVNIYINGDKPKSLEYYRNLLETQGLQVVVKTKEDLPKELSKTYDKSNLLIEFN